MTPRLAFRDLVELAALGPQDHSAYLIDEGLFGPSARAHLGKFGAWLDTPASEALMLDYPIRWLKKTLGGLLDGVLDSASGIEELRKLRSLESLDASIQVAEERLARVTKRDDKLYGSFYNVGGAVVTVFAWLGRIIGKSIKALSNIVVDNRDIAAWLGIVVVTAWLTGLGAVGAQFGGLTAALWVAARYLRGSKSSEEHMGVFNDIDWAHDLPTKMADITTESLLQEGRIGDLVSKIKTFLEGLRVNPEALQELLKVHGADTPIGLERAVDRAFANVPRALREKGIDTESRTFKLGMSAGNAVRAILDSFVVPIAKAVINIVPGFRDYFKRYTYSSVGIFVVTLAVLSGFGLSYALGGGFWGATAFHKVNIGAIWAATTLSGLLQFSRSVLHGGVEAVGGEKLMDPESQGTAPMSFESLVNRGKESLSPALWGV